MSVIFKLISIIICLIVFSFIAFAGVIIIQFIKWDFNFNFSSWGWHDRFLFTSWIFFCNIPTVATLALPFPTEEYNNLETAIKNS